MLKSNQIPVYSAGETQNKNFELAAKINFPSRIYSTTRLKNQIVGLILKKNLSQLTEL